MDVRMKLVRRNANINIEIQRIKNSDEFIRALNYVGGLLIDRRRGEKELKETMNIVMFIYAFDPFEGTKWEGQTRMSYVLKSEDDSKIIHTIGDEPYPFEGIKIVIYNGRQKWKEKKPKSKIEEKIKTYLEDMKEANPEKIKVRVTAEAVRECKGEEGYMDKAEEWIRYKYGDQLKKDAQILGEIIGQKKAEKMARDMAKDMANEMAKENDKKYAKILLEKGVSMEEVATLTGLSLNELNAL